MAPLKRIVDSADSLHEVELNQQPPPQFDSRPPARDHSAGTHGTMKEEQLLGVGVTPKPVDPLVTLNETGGSTGDILVEPFN